MLLQKTKSTCSTNSGQMDMVLPITPDGILPRDLIASIPINFRMSLTSFTRRKVPHGATNASLAMGPTRRHVYLRFTSVALTTGFCLKTFWFIKLITILRSPALKNVATTETCTNTFVKKPVCGICACSKQTSSGVSLTRQMLGKSARKYLASNRRRLAWIKLLCFIHSNIHRSIV